MPLATTTQTASTIARDEVRRLVNQLALLVANRSTTVLAGITIGTTASKVKITNAITYSIDGANLAKGATDDFWTLSGTTVAASSFQKYLLLIDAAGAASVMEGTQSTVSAAAVVLPSLPQSKAVLGVLTVATSAAGTFIPGTTLLSAAQVTDTYIDGFDVSSLFQVTL